MPKNNSRVLLSWAFYDWANSAFSAIIETFVFATYFVAQLAPGKEIGVSYWGLMLGIAGFIIALCGPVMGGIADYSGRRKFWLALFAAISILCTALLWFMTPAPGNAIIALLLVGLAILGSELSCVFYNAMLPNLAEPSQIGRWSGWGWGFGYIGGVVSLALCLFAFIQTNAWIQLDRSTFQDVRATFLLTAAWYFVFALPLIFLVPKDKPTQHTLGESIKIGIQKTLDTLKQARNFKGIFWFLIARMFYTDGLITLFAFGGVYAAAAFGMSEQEILWFAISLNVTAGIGSFLFGYFDDRIGSKKMILFSLVCLIFFIGLALAATSEKVFWICGLFTGIFVGPVQASSRAYLARMAPASLRNQMFGFFALTGRATSFLGPLFVSMITYATGSTRIGMSVIIVFLVIGGLLLLRVPVDRRNAESGR